jgi:hypothetical protein
MNGGCVCLSKIKRAVTCHVMVFLPKTVADLERAVNSVVHLNQGASKGPRARCQQRQSLVLVLSGAMATYTMVFKLSWT